MHGGPILISKKKAREFRIESLDLNIATPTALTSFTDHYVDTHKIPNTVGTTNPGEGLNSFGHCIDEILLSKEGDTVRENVGVMTLCLNGVER